MSTDQIKDIQLSLDSFGKKEVSQTPRESNRDLFVFQCIKNGMRPSQICKHFGINKKTIQYHISTLKRSGFIKKIGYGVWEIVKEYNEKEVSKSSRVTIETLEGDTRLLSPDKVRAHAFQWRIKLPKIKSWENREEIFKKNEIKFKEIKFGSIKRGQGIEFRGRKIWLLNNSIIIYERSSYLADTAKDAKKHAVYELMNLIHGLENLLGANFSIGKGQYVFKATRQHYALVKNALAKQYDKEGNKLQVYNSTGLWFLIDNSFNLHEAETVHPHTSDGDNEKVQTHFNHIKDTSMEVLRDFTPQFVVTSLAQNAQNLSQYAMHLQSHVKSVQDLGAGVSQMTQQIGELSKVIQELKGGHP